ncbi:FAD:protein FMN transferase [Janthinobacterium fluminis]|uniref:FAD:protein FMN transferase n=1 Tax=Janthinobacterium fluminis TaxID=2987524 RepID=A0ABT5K0W1_9BURK|nr:FAD:protein FMN transferase [Janthinobacterium fluminis]MDC8758613.1 FAD:protein FMN transferase [Janthinobacterium fluminis]
MIRRAQPWLGTLVDIHIADPLPDAEAHRAAALAFADIALVHRLMSFHDGASDVARLNLAAPGTLTSVHEHTWRVLQLAQRVAAASDGIFNIACAPQLVAWNYLPAPRAAAPRYRPGLDVLGCERDGAVRKHAPGWIDLGGIAKGYAVDLAVAALARAGVRSACVNAGGDLRVLGAATFPVAIRAPWRPQSAAAELPLRDGALATSANYFSARVQDGVPVGAFVDGRDGKPAGGAASVTVLAPACAAADALTKVVLASGDAQHPALAAFGASALII